MTKRIAIGSRKSALALAQSEWVKARLASLMPDACIEIEPIETEGDRRLDRALAEIGGKGLFTFELEERLRNGSIDLAVHSLKDMPQLTPDDLPIAAFSRREDPRDALILPPGRTIARAEAVVFGTSSPRRMLQLRALYPKASFVTLRGNVNTRLAKLERGVCDATVLAVAGLKRLGLDDRISQVFSTDAMIPAAGQGILAIQTRRGPDIALQDALTALDDADSRDCYAAESAFLRTLQADCTSPVGAHAHVLEGAKIALIAVIADRDDAPFVIDVFGSRDRAAELGRTLAQTMIERIARQQEEDRHA